MRRLGVIASLTLVSLGCSGDATSSAPAPVPTEQTEMGAEPEHGQNEPRAMGTFSPPVTLLPTTPDSLDTPDSPDGSSSDETDPGQPGQRRPSELVAGECLDLASWNDPSNSEQTSLTVVSCEDPHDAEVFARVSLDDNPDSPYPGDEHVTAAADRVCFERFEDYVGMRYVDARLEIVHLRPPRAAWIRTDRNVICMLVNANLEPLLGSLAADR